MDNILTDINKIEFIKYDNSKTKEENLLDENKILKGKLSKFMIKYILNGHDIEDPPCSCYDPTESFYKQVCTTKCGKYPKTPEGEQEGTWRLKEYSRLVDRYNAALLILKNK